MIEGLSPIPKQEEHYNLERLKAEGLVYSRRLAPAQTRRTLQLTTGWNVRGSVYRKGDRPNKKNTTTHGRGIPPGHGLRDTPPTPKQEEHYNRPMMSPGSGFETVPSGPKQEEHYNKRSVVGLLSSMTRSIIATYLGH